MNLQEYLQQTLHNAVAPARFIVDGAKSVYDSVDRQANPQNHQDDAGNYYPGQEPGQPEDALNIALSAMNGGMPFAPRGAGTLGTIKFPGATGYSDKLATKAEAAIQRGMPLEQAWKKFGYHPWRKGMVGEISDKGATWNESFLTKLLDSIEAKNKAHWDNMPKDAGPEIWSQPAPRMETVDIAALVNHPELFKEYPALKKAPVNVFLQEGFEPLGNYAAFENPYDDLGRQGYINMSDEALRSPKGLEVFIHELDHKLNHQNIPFTDSYMQPRNFQEDNPYKTFEDYLADPFEVSARMRETRIKSGLNSPLYDAMRIRHGSPIQKFVPGLTDSQKEPYKLLRDLGPEFSETDLKSFF